MKKIISIITIAIMLILLCTQSFANNTGKIILACNDSVNAGEEITVKISGLGLGEGINGLQGKITYDTNVLEYVSKKAEKETWSITGYNESTGIFLAEVINVLEAEAFEGNEEEPIISFTFKVKNDTTAKDTKIAISDIVISPATVQIENNYADKEITIINDIDTNETPSETPSEDEEQTPDTPAEPEETPKLPADNTISQEKIPHAGLDKSIILIFISIMLIMFSSYKGYNKYRGIR